MGFQKISMLEYLEPEMYHATLDSLLKECRAELMVRCSERGLSSDGTKQDLACRLLKWRQNYKPGKLASTPHLSIKRETTIELKKRDFEYIDRELLCEEYGLIDYCTLSINELTFLEHLGTGGFKDCHRGKFRSVNVAILEFRAEKARKMDIPFFKNELEILRRIKHPNIVTVHGVVGHESRLMVVTELCINGDLLSYMGKTPKPPFTKQLQLMKDLAQAVNYLHTLTPPIVHRDLKPDNVLVNYTPMYGANRFSKIDDNATAKLTDFGEAHIWEDPTQLMKKYCGTRNWQAPEYHTCTTKGYTEKVDIFALSLIFWQILLWDCNKIPYKYCHVGIFATEVSDKQMRPSLEGLEGYPKVLLTLLVAMWSPNPDERPKASYIVYLLKKLMDHLPTAQPNTRPCDFKKSTKINATPFKHSNYLKVL